MSGYPRSGFSLASVLLLVTVAAVVMAAAATALKHGGPDAEQVAMFVPIGVLIGTTVGAAIAYGRTRKLRWAFAGSGVGLFAGAVAALVSAFPGAAPALVLGSLIIVLYAGIVRTLSHRPRR